MKMVAIASYIVFLLSIQRLINDMFLIHGFSTVDYGIIYESKQGTLS